MYRCPNQEVKPIGAASGAIEESSGQPGFFYESIEDARMGRGRINEDDVEPLYLPFDSQVGILSSVGFGQGKGQIEFCPDGEESAVFACYIEERFDNSENPEKPRWLAYLPGHHISEDRGVDTPWGCHIYGDEGSYWRLHGFPMEGYTFGSFEE